MTRPVDPARPDIYARITNQIIDQLEAGVRPWTQPWTGGAPVTRPLRHDGTPYSGVNILLLWSEAFSRGFASPTWMTFRQALALGAHVRRGERGSTVIYANQIVRTEAKQTERRERIRRWLTVEAIALSRSARREDRALGLALRGYIRRFSTLKDRQMTLIRPDDERRPTDHQREP